MSGQSITIPIFLNEINRYKEFKKNQTEISKQS